MYYDLRDMESVLEFEHAKDQPYRSLWVSPRGDVYELEPHTHDLAQTYRRQAHG